MTDDGQLSLQKYCAAELCAADLHPIAGGAAIVHSSRSPAKVTDNEDAAAVIACNRDTAVLAVADGMGGGAAGERASRIAVETLSRSVSSANGNGDSLRPTILDAIEEANSKILKLGVGAATTMAVAEIRGRTVRPYHVGDSTILLFGQRGKLKLQTVSHSPVGFAVEAGLLDEHEAIHHEDRHLVSNMLGTSEMRIEVGGKVKLAPRDTLLIASDGLFDNMHNREVIDQSRIGPIESALERLVDTTQIRMRRPSLTLPSKPDDLTIVLFRPTHRSRKSRA